MKTISGLPVWFLKQKRTTKLMIGGLGLFLLAGLCGGFFAIVARLTQQSSTIAIPNNSVVFITWTPVTTNTAIPLSTATPSPIVTRTPLPTGLPTQSLETPTVVVLPTTSSVARSGVRVLIIYVDKKLEYVDIQNAGGAPASINRWVLVSEVGKQSCVLKGILQPKEVLRIWAGVGEVGISCGFKRTIWLDNDLDPAVLYNADGQEVSRYPKP